MNRAFVFAICLLTFFVPLFAAGSEPLPVIGPAPDFTLTAQDGTSLALTSLRGKVVAVSFIYTACPDICPLLTQKLAEAQDVLGPDFGSRIVFVSITIDPEHDTPQVLKDFAATLDANWSFLTGPPAVVREVARQYGVVAIRNTDGFIDHNLVTSLIDPQGMLRVQYLGWNFNPDEFRRDLLSLVEDR